MKKCICILFVYFFANSFLLAQNQFVVQGKKGVDKIHFQLINNLIVIPVSINGVELSFILDTGVSKPIIFNFLNSLDSLQIKNSETIFLRGLGEDKPVKALKSTNNIFKIGNAINVNQDLYAIYNAKLNFAPRLGIPIHGIIGYDFFKDLIVEVHYGRQFIKVINPTDFNNNKCKKCDVLPLEFFNNKPYLNINVKLNGRDVPVKLLIDSGGSDSLWLFEDEMLNIQVTNNYFHDFLGHGLSGTIYGKRSKVESVSVGRFVFNNANVAFPDAKSINHVKHFKGRNGSLAGNILKRFNLIFDYHNKRVLFKKSRYYKDDFSYNKSGIELMHDGLRLVTQKHRSIRQARVITTNVDDSTPVINNQVDYKLVLKPAYSISELREKSPAYNAGLKVGDIILVINNKKVEEFTLQEIMQKFYGKAGELIKIKIDRNGTELKYQFYLESLLN